MSDTTGTPAEGTPDSTPTEALQLADQEPVAVTPGRTGPCSRSPAVGCAVTPGRSSRSSAG